MGKREAAEARGRRAEALAAWWLRAKGYMILSRRVRLAVGEIDLVARKGDVIVFIEVKERATLDDAPGCVTPAAWRRIAAGRRKLDGAAAEIQRLRLALRHHRHRAGLPAVPPEGRLAAWAGVRVRSRVRTWL